MIMAWKADGATDAPLAGRDREWDASAADGRLRSWAGGPDKDDINWGQYRRGFLAHDSDSQDFGGVKLPFCDVIDGELHVVPRGVFAAAGGRGVNAADLPDDVKGTVRQRINRLYGRMRREFDDPGLESPFEGSSNKPHRERKHFGEFKLDIDTEQRTVTGIASVMGLVDDGGDLIPAGAYLKTLQEHASRMRWLWMHDAYQPPVAKILEIREVGRMELPADVTDRFPEATGGLMVRRQYLDTQRGNEILAGIRAGAIAEMSIGYDAIQVEFPENLLVNGRRAQRILKEIRLWECSDVNWGMNPATVNTKTLLQQASLEELVEQLREAGRLQDVYEYVFSEKLAANHDRLQAEMRKAAEVQRRRQQIAVRERLLNLSS